MLEKKLHNTYLSSPEKGGGDLLERGIEILNS